MMKKNFKKLVYLSAFAAVFSAHAGSFEDFFRAVRADNPSGVRSLLQRGFDPNTRDERGQTGLLIALREPSPKVIQVLLESPQTNVELRNAKDESPLMLAAIKGQQELVTQLIKRDADINKPGWTPLHYAASGPDTAVVRLLLDRGAAVNAESPNRTTPLMMAAQYGSEASVELLLSRGADPKARNDRGLGAADFARSGQRDALAARLEALAR